MKQFIILLLSFFILFGCNKRISPKNTLHQSSEIKKDEIFLKLNTQGHTSQISDIIVTKSGDIISASSDKTIKVWDSKTGKEKRKILGEIEEGNKGRIDAIALNPGEEILAVGGFLGNNSISKKVGLIRLYDYKTGKLFKILKSHSNVVFDLSFSEDGKYLVSGSGDSTAKIWNMSTFKVEETIPFHKQPIRAVKMFKKNKDYFVVTAGYDKKVALYSMKMKKVIKIYPVDYELFSIAISGKDIAVAGDSRDILILDKNLKFKRKISTKTEPKGLAYSPNKNFLISGFSYYFQNSKKRVNIYDKSQNYKKIFTFRGNNNLTLGVAFLNDNTAVSAGGRNNQIYIWNWTKKKIYTTIKGVGDIVPSVGINKNSIAWGYTPIYYTSPPTNKR